MDSGFAGRRVQFCVFCLGLLQKGDVGVRVFPEREEILVTRPGFGGITPSNVGLSQTLKPGRDGRRPSSESSPPRSA